ncbi:unnamed protein product [Leuciscus chuanchicus]
MKPSCYDNDGKAVKRKYGCTPNGVARSFSFMDAGANTYLIRPNYKDKFKAGVAKECIREILREQLYGVQYNPDEVPTLSTSLVDSIKNKLKDVGFDKYKLIVQVVVGEQRGQGVKMVARCLWDADTDSCAQDIYMNDSLFCVAAAFGVYHY